MSDARTMTILGGALLFCFAVAGVAIWHDEHLPPCLRSHVENRLQLWTPDLNKTWIPVPTATKVCGER